ncbi:MAG: hypothetical protein JWN11_659 [Hyphomicrobiales bacterium]|nr:hypothetical protein [Hyphomicrobiales bacterium]
MKPDKLQRRESDMPESEMANRVPQLRTDTEAEEFLAQDLSDLDFSQFKLTHFEFEKREQPDLYPSSQDRPGK